MDNLILEVANKIANNPKGKMEQIGYHHNQVLFYINSKTLNSKNDLEKMKRLCESYFLKLPSNTFGKIIDSDYGLIVKKVIESSKFDELKTWKPIKELSKTTNDKISALIELIKGFTNGQFNIESGKKAIEEWEAGITQLKLANTESTILRSSGAIARHSLAFWILNELTPNDNNTSRKRCKREREVKRALMDIIGGIFGGLVGGTVAGPVGAGVGSAAGSAIVSAVYQPV